MVMGMEEAMEVIAVVEVMEAMEVMEAVDILEAVSAAAPGKTSNFSTKRKKISQRRPRTR